MAFIVAENVTEVALMYSSLEPEIEILWRPPGISRDEGLLSQRPSVEEMPHHVCCFPLDL